MFIYHLKIIVLYINVYILNNELDEYYKFERKKILSKKEIKEIECFFNFKEI